jgi:hypothetical protein
MAAFGLVLHVLAIQTGLEPCPLRTVHTFMKATQIILLFMVDTLG